LPAGPLRGFPGKLVVLLCFAALLALGVALHRDHGIAFDEPFQHDVGVVNTKNLFDSYLPAFWRPVGSPVTPLAEFKDRDYGAAFETPLVMLERAAGLTDSRDIFLFRHLLTFLFCVCGTYALYCLALRRFADRRLALLAAAFLVLTPRLFAESFYNSKDVVFMAAFAIALNTAVAFVLQPTIRMALVHALATAFAIDIRLAAIVLPAATVAILVVRTIKRELPVRSLVPLAVHLATMVVLVGAAWPWLWADPIGHFAQALENMSSFRFPFEVLYRGDFPHATDLPWHYIPVWISVTTPPLYLALFAVGAAATAWGLATAGRVLWRNDAGLQDLIFLGLFVAPIAAAIVLGSTLYDGWRHLYFIYPAFLMIALKGWLVLWKVGSGTSRLRRPAVAVVTAGALLATAVWMGRAHPLQNVYFNDLAGPGVLARYEVDYWGLANRRALEHLLEHDKSETIYVLAANILALETSFLVLRPQQRDRIRETSDGESPHYAFTTWLPFRDP
jgi:4-amino-4-deoxy-L-arabinose transferase-like glycosyltransferase